MHIGVIYALLAAALFGASTPFAKTLVDQVAPVTLAGMLYLGSGLGLLFWYVLRAVLTRKDQGGIAGLRAKDLQMPCPELVEGLASYNPLTKNA